MSKVCTIIAYIVSIYSNIEQWNLALSYSILLLSLACLKYLHLMNLSQLLDSMFVYIDNNLYINICIMGNQG